MKSLTIGYCDGAEYMMGIFRVAFPRAVSPGTEVQFLLNPTSSPDVLIYSFFGEKHKQYDCRKIFVSGEPKNLSRLQVDLLIDCKNDPSLRRPGLFFYMPFYVTSFHERFQNAPEELVKLDTPNIETVLASKTKFCAFLYSRPVEFRNSLYDIVSSYKQVDALGKARGKDDYLSDRNVYEVGKQTFNDLAVQKYCPYKFVICCENSRHQGYITEKIISAMLANAIPIYLGAPDITDHFNPDSFIDVAAFPNWERAVQRIKEIDQDTAQYKMVLKQPWQKSNMLSRYFQPDCMVPILQQFLAEFLPHC
jgi:hypothetical protein